MRRREVEADVSWLNQVEIWFSILSRKALAGSSFTSPQAVRERIDAFVAAYNQTARPFSWTKTHLAQKTLKPRFADL